MKKMMKRLLSAVLAASMSLGLLGTAAAADVPDPVNIGIDATAVGTSESAYDVTYQADLTMSEAFAKIPAFLAGTEQLENLRFTCYLEDALVKQMTKAEVAEAKDDIVFTGGSASYFEMVDVGKNASGVEVVYKLDVDKLTYLSATERMDALTDKMVMESSRSVAAENINNAKDKNGAIKSEARVEITYTTGAIPGGYGDKVLAAEGEGTMAITEYVKPPVVVTEYNVKVATVSNGKVTVSTEKAAEGVTVAITAAPNDGYKLSALTVTDANGKAVAVVNGKFTMPASDVTVKAEFEKKESSRPSGSSTPSEPEEELYKITVKSAEFGSVSAPAESEAGKTVTVTVTPDEGYRLTNITVSGGVKVERKSPTVYTFVMPENDVTVTSVFALSAARPEETGVDKNLITTEHIVFMTGDDKGNFRPNANITRAEVAQIFYALLKDKNIELTASFDDVDENAWYATAVKTLASLGAVAGVGDGKFDPNRQITRAEFATIAVFFADHAVSYFKFDDVHDAHWAYDFIMHASAYGWVAGTGDNNFQPDRNITRAEAATIVNNMLGRIGDYANIDAGLGRQFPDVDKSHWGWYEIGEATYHHGHGFNDSYTEESWLDK